MSKRREIHGQLFATWRQLCRRWGMSALVAALLLTSSLPQVVLAEQFVAGDLAPAGAPDGQLNAGDLVRLHRMVLGLITPTVQELLIGDVAPLNAPDGVLTAADLVVLQRAVMGLITLPPIVTGPNAPVLNDPGTTTTTSNPFTITGTADANKEVRLYINGTQRANKTSNPDGTFSFSAALFDGFNIIHATIWDGSDESSASNSLTLNYTNTISRNQSGTISTNTVWTPAGPGGVNDPYIITGNLTVPAGVTFTIQSGTVFKFNAGVQLMIYGQLLVNGTSASPVTFTSNKSTPAKGDWVGIVVNATATGVVIDGGIIEWASTGVEFFFYDTPPVDTGSCDTLCVKNSIIQNNVTGIRAGNNASPVIIGNVITSNSFGIFASGSFTPSSNPKPIVNNNSIYNNAYENYNASGLKDAGALLLNARNNWWGSTDVATIADKIVDHSGNSSSTFAYVDFGGYLDMEGGTPSSAPSLLGPLSDANPLVAGTTYELLGDIEVLSGETLTIPAGITLRFSSRFDLYVRGTLLVNGTSGNPVTFTSSKTNPAKGDWPGIRVTSTATRVVLDGAVIEWADTGVYFDNTGLLDTGACDTLCVKNSLIHNNNFGIQTFGQSSPLIMGNTITDNSSGIWATGNTSNPQPTITNNSIYNNFNTNYYTASYNNAQALLLNARNNWWGSADPQVIASTIVDNTDSIDNSFPYVDYSGYLETEGGVPRTKPSLLGPLSDANPLFTGIDYEILGDIAVLPGETLTIPAGLTLRFSLNFDLQVEGTLLVSGTAGSPVTFTSARASPAIGDWTGINVNSTATGVVIDHAIIEYAGRGIYFENSTGTVSNCEIRQNYYGVYIYRNSTPTLNGNLLIDNAYYGVYVYGTNSDTTNPQPLINGNDIYGNGSAGLFLDGFGLSSTLQINATGNWWGTSVPAQVDAQLQGDRARIDYTGYTSGPLVGVGPPSLDVADQSTANPSFPVAGAAATGAQVRIYVNGTEQVTLNVAQDGTFSGVVTLAEGQNSIYAEAFNQVSTSGPSQTATVTLDTIPPVITLTEPISGNRINAYPMFKGSINEPATLTIAGQSVNIAADNNTFNYGPVTLTEGANSLSIVATDIAGNQDNQSINLTLDTTPPADPFMGSVSFGPLTGGYVNVSGVTGAIEPGAEVHIANARSGVVVRAIADINGEFSVDIAALTGDTLTLVVTDDLGNQTTWNQSVIPGAPAALSISSVIPTDGTVINNTQTYIAGDYQGPEGTGIVVNGHVAELYGNRFIAHGIQLVEGPNPVEITATTVDGATYTHTLSLTSTGAVPFSVSLSPEIGMVPLPSVLTVINNTNQPMQTLQIDLNNDGSYEASYTNLNYSRVSINITYNTPGLKVGRVHVVDNTGAGYDLSFSAAVEQSIGKQARLRAVYQQMLGRLGQNDIPGALNHIMGTSRDRFEQVFNHLSADFPTVIAGLGVVDTVEIGPGLAQLRVVRDTAGQKRAYFVTLVRSGDGIWRVEDM